MLAEVDSRELSRWRRHYALEPWGFQMENVRFGTLATEVGRPNYKAWGLPKPGDWFKPAKGPVGQTEDDMKAVVDGVMKQWPKAKGK